MHPVLQTTNLKKSYGNVQALRGIDLQVQAGEFVALLGPNGAGKSTLFQLLTGLFSADDGEINIADHNIRHNATKALAIIGVVFQQPTLDLALSVEANLRFHARLHNIGHVAKQRIHNELQHFNLLEQLRTPCEKLSGGNRRRVELARALLHQPQLLLMDEATVGLDPNSRQQLLEMIENLCKQRGLGVLWATHLVDEVERADRVIVLHRGEVLFNGTTSELCEKTQCDNLKSAFLQLTG